MAAAHLAHGNVYNQVWTKEKHKFLPLDWRLALETLVLVHLRRRSLLSKLPKDLLWLLCYLVPWTRLSTTLVRNLETEEHKHWGDLVFLEQQLGPIARGALRRGQGRMDQLLLETRHQYFIQLSYADKLPAITTLPTWSTLPKHYKRIDIRNTKAMTLLLAKTIA